MVEKKILTCGHEVREALPFGLSATAVHCRIFVNILAVVRKVRHLNVSVRQSNLDDLCAR